MGIIVAKLTGIIDSPLATRTDALTLARLRVK